MTIILLLREGVSDHLQLLIPTLALDHWIAAARSHYSDDHDDDADEEWRWDRSPFYKHHSPFEMVLEFCFMDKQALMGPGG